MEALKEFQPSVIIIDSGEDSKALEYCKKIKFASDFSASNIIFTSTMHDKEKILSAGADLYLPKPYEISVIFSWVAKFTEEFNS
jgi:DNA-binding response OmpR family regulator